MSFYPPGIPLIWPGELIITEMVEYIQEGLKARLMVSGPLDSTLETIQIVEAE